jgi:hypothetical protein
VISLGGSGGRGHSAAPLAHVNGSVRAVRLGGWRFITWQVRHARGRGRASARAHACKGCRWGFYRPYRTRRAFLFARQSVDRCAVKYAFNARIPPNRPTKQQQWTNRAAPLRDGAQAVAAVAAAL